MDASTQGTFGDSYNPKFPLLLGATPSREALSFEYYSSQEGSTASSGREVFATINDTDCRPGDRTLGIPRDSSPSRNGQNDTGGSLGDRGLDSNEHHRCSGNYRTPP